MLYTKVALFMFSFATLSAFAEESLDKGYRLPGETIIKDFNLMKLTPEKHFLASHIIKINYKIPTPQALEIAHHILNISACFKIDPWVLTALIQKESSFNKDAVSPTNAAGLTQFTSSGIKEVNDQLGFRGRAGATEGATLYFTSQIRDCIDPSWVDLWVRVELPETDPEFYRQIKEEIKKDIPTAITYGAILLKTYVAFINIKNNRSASEEGGDLPKSEIYFRALQIYNGEEGTAKVNYAKNVFKNLQGAYPNHVSFPFLAD
jgi:hypothetical protein